MLFGKSGIITRAKKGQEIADVATAQEKLELIKSEIPMKILDGKDSTVNLNNYLEELNKDKNKKDCDVTNIEKLNDINAEITISGKYKFIAKDEENGNVKIIYLGEAGGLQISPTEATYRYPTAGTFEVISNESQGKLTVKSSNEEIAKASISGTTVTVTPQKMTGIAQIVVTSEANGKYAEGRVTHTAKVENGTILLEAEPYIGEYDGKAHDALISVTVEPKDCKLEYSLNGGKFTEVMPKVTMAADEYTISIKASKEGYTTNAITKTVTIKKQTNTNGNLTLSATSGTITYPNNGTFTVTKNTSGGALSVKSSDESVATASISGTTVTITPKVPTTDGKETTITVTSAATSNYEAQTATYVATIKMGTITINATAYSGKYDGKAHNALTAVSTEPTGTTLRYNLDGKGWQTSIPEVTGAGSYTIAIEASKAGYVTKTKTDTISTINKQTNTNGNLVLTPTSGTITYPNNGTFTVSKNVSGGALSVKSSDESIATASISGTTVTVTPKTPSVNGKEVTITVTSAATSNYEAQTATYVAKIEMGTITINATAYKGNYDGKSHPALTAVSTDPMGTTLRYNLDGKGWQTSIPEVTGAGSYTIAIEASKAGYVTKTKTDTISTINKQTNTNGNLTLSATSGTITYPNNGTFTVTKNTSGGALSVKSSDESIATASISGTTVTVTPKVPTTDGKKTTITVTSAATSNYEAQTATYVATIKMGTITINATAYSGKYDGKAHPALTAVSTNPTGTTIEYSLNGGTYSTTMPQVTGASEYSISIRATKAGYAKAETTKTVTVGKQTNTNGNLTLSATSGTITYPNNGTFTVTKNTSGGALSVKSSDESIATASISGTTVTITPKVPTTDGKKTTITVTSAATSNYEAQTATYVATIKMGTITINATAYSGKYDGKAHNALTEISTDPTGTTIEYALNGGTYSTTMPQVTGASEYSISIRATKAGYTKAETTKTVTVNKQANANGNLTLSATSGTITYPNNGTFTVSKNVSGGALSVKSSDESIATASISGTTVTVTPKTPSVNGKEVTITVTSAATSNYEAQTATYVATVNMGKITINATAYSGKYDGKAHPALTAVSTNPTGTTIEYSLNGGAYSTTMPQVTGASEYSISIRATKAGYAKAETTKTITVNKQANANGNLTLSATSGTITYPNNGTFTVTKNTSGGALSVTSSDTSVATASISGTTVTITPKVPTTDGKKTTITVTSAATSNYETQTTTYVATVKMGTITINATAYNGNYDGKAHPALTSVSTNPTGTTIEYSLNGGTYSTTMPQVTGASTYSISIRATKAGYAKAETTKTITVNKQVNANGNLTLSAASGTITYPNNGTFTVTKNTSGGALSVKSSDESVATASISGTTVTITPKVPTTDGKKTTITVTSAATSNYEAQTATYVATIKMGTITINATPYNGNYDGKTHPALTAVSTNPTGTTIEYSLNGGTFGTTMPQVSSIGTYSIAIKASKTGYVTANTTITLKMKSAVYAKLYTDGTLIFSSTDYTDSSRTVSENYGDISSDNDPKWLGNYTTTNKASNIIIHDKIYPTDTNCWFSHYKGTTLDLKNLDTSNVTNMDFMFYDCSNLTSLDVSNFDTSKVTKMRDMFGGCKSLTSLNLSNFNTSNVTDMSYMFGSIMGSCSNLTSLDLSNFNTSKVTNMSGMFYGCENLTSLNVSNFNTSNVTNMSYMFGGFMSGGCSKLTTLDLRKFDTSKVTNMDYMFNGCSSLTSLNVSNFNTSNVTNMSSMFDGCRSLTSLDLKNFDTSKVINMSSMFGSYGMGCRNLTSLNVSSFDTSNVTNMSSMFYECNNLTSLNLSNFNTSKVTDMSGMFNECSSLTSLNVSSFNTSKVTNMRGMFCDCSNLTSLNLSNFNTSNVTNMRSMFEGCERLTSLNVSNFNTSNVTDMSSMFGATLFVGCKSLTSLDLSNFNTSKVTDMSGMFRGCSGLTSLNVSNFNTSKVTNMSSMFGGFMHVGCSKLTSLDLRNFDTSKVTSMNAMFDGCRNLTKIMVGSKWIINSGTDTTDMFSNCGTQTVTKQ